MKSYLELAPISAKIHRKQNRMSKFCIILAVFMVTVIFGMADMFIRCQKLQVYKTDGNWHVVFRDISNEEAELIAVRPDVKASSWYGVINYSGDMGYTLQGKNAVICGLDESFCTDIFSGLIAEGEFPAQDDEALAAVKLKESLGLKTGDHVTVDGPGGEKLTFKITGFTKNTAKIMSEDSAGLFLATDGFRSIYPETENGGPESYNSVYYVQFSSYTDIRKSIAEITEQFGLAPEQATENSKLLGLMGQSRDPLMLYIYGSAFILFLLVMAAGILMISSSLNSNVAQRIQFFGMMRCIGSTPKQVMRLVIREALGWCRAAIPTGVISGIVSVWALCAMLRILSPGYFQEMPVFEVSIPSILTGICSGFLTVLLAARSPAKRASKVSPLTAVSGNADNAVPVRRAANTRLFKVDTALGVHHAKASMKNFLLMVGSFALSIILFLSFSVTVDFMHHAIVPMKPGAPDISLKSQDGTNSLSSSLMLKLTENPAASKVYGQKYAIEIPAEVNGEPILINLVSYDENQFKWAEDTLLEGSVEETMLNTDTGLLVHTDENKVKDGDTITLNINGTPNEIKISGVLSTTPFSIVKGVSTVVCSEDTFKKLLGEENYAVINLQLTKDAAEEDVNMIRQLAGPNVTFSDKRLSNQEAVGSYYSFSIFIYGFLVFIALITVFNILNSIAMSVSARMKQYGAMRAVGMSSRQLVKMVAAEAVTYAVIGSIAGCIAGIPLNKLLFRMLVTYQWGDTWTVPFGALGVIITIVFLSSVIAVYGPAKRIHNMSVVDTISG